MLLAVPALFAACTQDEIVDNASNQQSTELLGKVAGDVNFVVNAASSTTRLSWDQENNKAWDLNDAFSLFWVGAEDDNQTTDNGEFIGVTNALYQSKDGGVFTSNNIVYEGNHFIVYPVDKKHTTAKTVAVATGEQDNSVAVGERSVFVSDLLTIKAAPAKDKDRKEGVIYAGYNEPVNATVRPLSSYLALNLEFALTDKMKGEEIIIEGVELQVEGANVFTTQGNLALDGDFMSLVPTKGVSTLSLKVAEGTKITTNNTKYTANFTLLPASLEEIANAENSKIVVKTNFGDVRIVNAIDVVNPNVKEGNPYMSGLNGDTLYTKEEIEKAKEPIALDFKPMLETISTRKEDTKDVKGSYGRTVVRTVKVDMSKADINGRNLKNSTDLLKAYDVYAKLAKTDAAYFNLVPSNNIFEMTPEAVEAINNKTFAKITLNQGKTTGIKLVKGEKAHAAVPEFTNDIQIKEANYDLYLAKDGGAWTIDVQNAALVNAYKSVTNEGALTITQTAPAKPVELAKDLKNKGDITVSGKVAMPTVLTCAGTVTIPTGTELALNKDGNSFGGKVAINGVMKVHNETTFDKFAVVTVDGGMLISKNGMNEVHNLGTINVNTESTVQISTNATDEAMGVIVVKTRACSENIIIADKSKMGYIKWTVDENTTKFTQNSNEKINYLVINKNIEFANHSLIKYLEVSKDAMVNLKGQVNVATLTVGKGAYVTIPAGHKVNLTEDLTNNGDIIVNGAFTYPADVTKEGSVYWQNM